MGKKCKKDDACALFVYLEMMRLGATNDGGVCDSVSWYEGLLKIELPLIIAYDIISHKNRA